MIKLASRIVKRKRQQPILFAKSAIRLRDFKIRRKPVIRTERRMSGTLVLEFHYSFFITA